MTDVRGDTSIAGPYGGTSEKVPPAAKTRRGTANGNARGSNEERRRRREWLVETYRADVSLPEWNDQRQDFDWVPACRCYRCGTLLTADTLTVDRIKPGCRGGTYRRDNIRPACGRCNSVTGATTRRNR